MTRGINGDGKGVAGNRERVMATRSFFAELFG
jgi:hypothetical protein